MSSAVGSGQNDQLRRINLAIIGTGRIAGVHIASIHANRRCHLKWVVDVNENAVKEFSKNFSVPHWTTRVDDVLKDPDVNGVVVCVPTKFHADICIAAIRAGKAVLCEKPIAETLQDTQRVYDESEKYKVPVLCGYHKRFDPSYKSLKEQVSNGTLGEISLVNVTNRDHPLPSIEFLVKGGGDLFGDLTVHDSDVALWLMEEHGPPVSVFATSSTMLPELKGTTVKDTSVCVYRFESGAISTISNSRYAPYGYDQRLEVMGRKGAVTVGNPPSTHVMTLGSERGETAEKYHHSFPQRFKEAFFNEMDHFLDIVERKCEPAVKSEHVQLIALLVEAAHMSDKEKREIDFSSFRNRVTKSNL